MEDLTHNLKKIAVLVPLILITTAVSALTETNPFTRITFIKEATSTQVQVSIDEGWDINERDPRFGETALINSIRLDRLEIARLLIDAGADLNYHPVQKRSFPAALLLASGKGNVEAVSMLLEAGADIEVRGRVICDTPLIIAALHYRTDVVRILLEHGADPTARTCKDAPRYERKYKRADMTARDFAVKYKNRDMVDLLDAALLVHAGQPRKGCMVSTDSRFSDLAARHLGDRDRWREIWELNDMKKGQPIRAGDCFLLPDR